jgi:hypothetical protein
VGAELVRKLYTALAGSAGAAANRSALGLSQGLCRTSKFVSSIRNKYKKNVNTIIHGS